VDCSDWLSTWLFSAPFSNYRVHWVRPKWTEIELPMALDRTQVTDIPFNGSLPKSNVVCLHICRSGCWTPPWADQAFIDFVTASGKKPTIMQRGEWNPMVKRWTMADLRAAKKRVRDVHRAMKQMNHRNRQQGIPVLETR
jgi:hypothetical protein